MKLYATVTSERASKGQGGQYLLIDVLDEQRKKIANLHIYKNKEGTKNALSVSMYDIDMLKVDGETIEIKGNKKKDETCQVCNGKNIEGCSYCNVEGNQ